MSATILTNLKATPLQPTGPANSTAFNQTYTVADIVNGNYFVASGKDLVTVYNTDAINPHNLTVYSAPDDVGRKMDFTYSIPALTHAEFLVYQTSLYTQTNGTVQMIADNVAITFQVRSV